MRLSPLISTGAGLLLGVVAVGSLPARWLLVAPARDDGSGAAVTAGERWACPMMDFIGRRPGDCPVCGMKMTRVTAGELTREQQRRMDLRTAVVAEGPAHVTLRAFGIVRYDDQQVRLVIPRVAGRVLRRHEAARHAGTAVAAGDPVVDLYSPEAYAVQADLAAAVRLGDQATIRALTARLERWNLGAEAQALRGGAAPVDTITVRSPWAGRVVLGAGTEPDPDAAAPALPLVGQEVKADTVLLRLADPAAFRVVIPVPETQAHALRAGQVARLASDDRGELPEVAATVAWVAPALEQAARTREVHLHLRDPQGRLLPGSLLQVRLSAVLDPQLAAADPEHPATWGRFVLVPKAAVLSTGVRHVAWRVAGRESDGRVRFEPVPLALGPRLEDEAGHDHYVVRAGLRPGDEVATQGAFLLDSQAQLAGTPSLLFPTGAVSTSAGHAH
jgi:Cu(I)/Ag(I) efflux system membrane fusion protein